MAPTSLSLFFVFGSFFLAGILHPQEIGCLPYLLIYYITIPAMYLLLVIFSLFNLNNVSWGTRYAVNTYYHITFTIPCIWVLLFGGNFTSARDWLFAILAYLLHHNSSHVPTPGHFLPLQFEQCLMGNKVCSKYMFSTLSFPHTLRHEY